MRWAKEESFLVCMDSNVAAEQHSLLDRWHWRQVQRQGRQRMGHQQVHCQICCWTSSARRGWKSCRPNWRIPFVPHNHIRTVFCCHTKRNGLLHKICKCKENILVKFGKIGKQQTPKYHFMALHFLTNYRDYPDNTDFGESKILC